MRWEQGQHVCVVGSNGSGKSFLLSKLLLMRDYVIALQTKADDIKYDGFRTIKSIDQIAANQTKYLLKPKYERQRYECWRALELVWKQGRWCIDIDELFYACDRLKLDSPIERLLTQGRSLKVSVVCGMQRPSRVSRFALSEAIHVFVFRAEGRDVKIIAEATTPRIIPAIEALGRYEFAYFNRITGEIVIAKAQNLEDI